MVGIQGIGGVPEPRPDRSAGVRDSRSPASAESASDGDNVAISSQAQAVATLNAVLQASAIQPDIRADRVEAAQQAIENGAHHDPAAVREVAQRIERLL